MKEKVKVIGFREMDNYKVNHIINTTSRSKNWSKGLSPFFLGPVKLYGDYTAKNVENAWQFSKVYPQFADENENPKDDYFRWAEKGWSDSYAQRYPMGKGRKPLYSYWNGEKLGYIEARKKIYAPVYAKAVVRTEAFKKLLDLHLSGESYVLLDFDGYDYVKKGMTLSEVMNEPKEKMGHAFVLAMLLQYPEMRKKLGLKR